MCKAVQLEAFSKAVCETAEREYTREEISKSRPDLLIVEDKVYNGEKFRWAHPGGAVFVSLFGGRDATLAFQSYHMREFPHADMKQYLEGRLAPGEEPVQMDKDHLELSKKVKAALKHKTFAPQSQIIKAFAIFCFALAVELYALIFQRTFLNSALLGLLFAWIGLNIQHDANHGAMFKNGKYNALCGLAQSWIGGSQLMWLQEHVVLHHLHTGDLDMDPDAQLAPAMRGHQASPWYPWMFFQKFYLLAIELGYGLVPIFLAFAETLTWTHKFEAKYQISPLAKYPWRLASLLAHLFFYLRFLVLPFVFSDPHTSLLLEAAKVATTVAVGGGYLAFFFFLSHNFDGVEFVQGASPDGSTTYPEKSSFLIQQINSSSNVGGKILCFFNGGLNYQIEHHLFPRIAHSHYPTIAPIVRAFANSKGSDLVRYTHFPTVFDNLLSVFTNLDKLAVKPSSMKFD